MLKTLTDHILASLFRTFTGLGLGIAVGVPVGLPVDGVQPVADAILGPIFSSSARSHPSLLSL
jgi:ABC-type nitrate/sulfonate/bicarbonate transport system permease component